MSSLTECTFVTNIFPLKPKRDIHHAISMSPPPTRSSSHGCIQPHPLCGRSFRDVQLRPY
ncbi:hypothetical protein L210DRAFT_3565285, partial [Boletus edulis BED1]